MSRVAIFIFALCMFACAAFASPVSRNETTLEKRITHTGQGTWFDVGLGACGKVNVNTDFIVAISHEIYDDGAKCGKYMHITNNANSKSAYAMVRDECMGCDATAIDMSPSLFEALGELSQGVLDVSWHFENAAFTL